MSFIGSMLGIGGQSANPNQGAAGVNYQAQGTPIAQPVSVDQANTAYKQAQTGLAQQQAFLAALNGQNGIQNQNSVFNQQQAIANGQGPNPALAMLHQQTANNVAQQGALMASQRGAGANPALLARQAAQQGAATQQQAAGQAATLQANQSLNALNQLGGIAQNQVANRANATQGYNQAAQSEQENLLGAIQGQNNANVTMQSNINNANAGLANTVAKNQQGVAGGLLGGLSGVAGFAAPLLSSAFQGSGSTGGGNPGGSGSVGQAGAAPMVSARGGQVPSYAEGGPVDGPTSNAARFLYGSAPSPSMPEEMPANPPAAPQSSDSSSSPKSDPLAQLTQMASIAAMAGARGGQVPALVSPGEKYLNPREVKQVEQGKKSPIKAGETIPGKPRVGGARNSYANDTVPKTLEAGGIVLPRSVTQSKDPAKAAHSFVSAILARQKLKAPRK